jgi:uncharacterized iron-regulated membrane protein
MEGGIGILLLLIIAVVVGVLGIALYLSGGAIWSGKTKRGDGDGEGAGRPVHKRPRDPAQEKVEFVGTGQRDDDR